MSEKVHTIHIRKLSHKAYETLWNLRRYYEVTSWAQLVEKITEEYAEKIEELEWI